MAQFLILALLKSGMLGQLFDHQSSSLFARQNKKQERQPTEKELEGDRNACFQPAQPLTLPW